MQTRKAPPVIVKKYGNRRLYDTRDSRYVTLNELVDVIRRGDDVRVVDAKTGDDLTQDTLVQMILDGRGAATLLPISLLTQLVRMGDDALAEFLGRYMSYALELYLQAKQGAQAMTPWNPFASLPFTAASDVARFFGGPPAWANESTPARRPEPAPAENHAPQHAESDVAALRREIAELKSAIGGVRNGKSPRNRKKN